MEYDIIVIGAGIHGAAVAQAGAAAGYRTLVLEQYRHAACATSSKSSKLIHGGLRYLESGQFGLVRECLAERERLLRNAPHLVRLTPFHIPVYQDTRRRPWKIRLGLGLYALLGGRRFAAIPAREWPALDGLRREKLQAVFRYVDAQTDDSRLTEAVLASAHSLGAEIRYACRFEHAACDSHACIIAYREDGTDRTVRGQTLVNAAGPWVNRVLERVEPATDGLSIDLVQGTHLVLPGTLRRGMYYLEAPRDGRAIFVMPWRNRTLVGTTESLFTGDPENVAPLEEEIRYLLDVYNHYFAAGLQRSQVLEAFAGLRVLPKSEASAFHRSRDTLLHMDTEHCPRLLSIYGGKLTSHRATAERVIQRLRPLLPGRARRADTRTLALPPVEGENPA